MRVPIEWLHEYCAPDLEPSALAYRLAMTGTEVERVERHGVNALENFVVGKVLNAERHPDADRLSVCFVDIGAGAPSQIVCGAPNVAAGQTVAVAKPGAVMPDGTKLKKAKLRGQESNGMILAEDELAIGVEHNGIMVLNDTLAAGVPLAEVFPIATDVLVVEVTQNRRARPTPPPGARSASRRGRGTPEAPPAMSVNTSRSRCRTPTCARGSPRACSRT
jgi:phenylalanyl-tRNA synthetase beta chain